MNLWVESVAKAHELDHRIKGLIIGSGPEEDEIRELIKKYPFISMKKLYPTKVRLYKMLGSSMCMLNMSEREGLSIITIESAALGTAPVLPDYAPISKEVKELSAVKDVKGISKAIADIVSGTINYKVEGKSWKG
jgi:glycosyltransferase involved in cell wall biosynthesis